MNGERDSKRPYKSEKKSVTRPGPSELHPKEKERWRDARTIDAATPPRPRSSSPALLFPCSSDSSTRPESSSRGLQRLELRWKEAVLAARRRWRPGGWQGRWRRGGQRQYQQQRSSSLELCRAVRPSSSRRGTGRCANSKFTARVAKKDRVLPLTRGPWRGTSVTTARS